MEPGSSSVVLAHAQQEQQQQERQQPSRPDAAAAQVVAPEAVPAPRPALPPKVVIKEHDMSPGMQAMAVELAVNALSKFELERDMARYLKTQFDIRFQPTWHCLVGRHFGSYVTYEDGAFIYFYIDKLAILLFRSGNLMPKFDPTSS
jgi:dynein light chain LC8-type